MKMAKSVLVLLGKGGIEMSTIAEYFSNEIKVAKYSDTTNIFIDSVEIRNRLNSTISTPILAFMTSIKNH